MSISTKLREWRVGETCASHNLLPESMAEIEWLVMAHVKRLLGDDGTDPVVIRVDVDVEIAAPMKPAAVVHSWQVELPIKQEEKQP